MQPQRWWEGIEPPPELVLLTMKDIQARVPVKSRATIYTWIRHQQFPKPRIYVGNRAFWIKHEFDAWLHRYANE